MNTHLYPSSPALFTDFYELSMAYGYWKTGNDVKESVFSLTFREHPFGGGYTIACGLTQVVEFLKAFRFDETDIAYLADFQGNDGKPLFDHGFLDYLEDVRFTCDVDAIPEGTAVFPNEPLIRITGPIVQCQVLETALLNIINFQTLIATKASRICTTALGDPVYEFGLRRAQGFNGGLMASRAAYIGGCAGTSNVLAGKLWDIPVKGTHAHSWVMSYRTEEEAFTDYARALPNNCIFLVDTYDTLTGVRHAIKAGQWLMERGYTFAGIRLDSGDLAMLSREARAMLDEAGFHNTFIIGSGDLDEYSIRALKREGSPITVWGVGTRLVTGWNEPALGGVYKLTAVREPGCDWQYRLKLSDTRDKETIPGIVQIRRYRDKGRIAGDILYDERAGIDPAGGATGFEGTKYRMSGDHLSHEDLLVPVFRKCAYVYDTPGIHDIRERTLAQVEDLPPEIRLLDHPGRYSVGMDARLSDICDSLRREMSNRPIT